MILDALVEAVAAAGPAVLPDTGDLRADLRAVLRGTVAEFADPKLSASTRALTIEVASLKIEYAAQTRDRLMKPQLAGVRERLRAGQRAGQVRTEVDLDQAVELLFGPVYHRWLLRTGPLTEEYADQLVDLTLTAISP